MQETKVLRDYYLTRMNNKVRRSDAGDHWTHSVSVVESVLDKRPCECALARVCMVVSILRDTMLWLKKCTIGKNNKRNSKRRSSKRKRSMGWERGRKGGREGREKEKVIILHYYIVLLNKHFLIRDILQKMFHNLRTCEFSTPDSEIL